MITFIAIVASFVLLRFYLAPKIAEAAGEGAVMLLVAAPVAWFAAGIFGGGASGWIGGVIIGLLAATPLTRLVLGAGGFGGLVGGHGGSHVRGNALATPARVKSLVRREESRFKIGDIPFPRRLETLHFLVVGATGSGKSQTFHQILGPIRQSTDRAVVADVGGEFVSRYFRDGDIVFNPFDARSVAWSPLAEMRGEWDADKLAKSIVPDGYGSSAEWNGYAQTLLSAVLLRSWESGTGNNGELLRLLTRATPEELKAYVTGLTAEGLFADGADRMLASIKGILSSYIKPLQHLDPDAGADAFSIRDWVENGEGWMFLSFTDGQFPSLKQIIAAVLDVSISALLELPPSNTRRIWFAVDEFSTFGAIQSIEPLLTKGRKYGAVALFGLQSLSQIRDSYGIEKAQTLLSCLGTWTALRCSDAETAEYMSVFLGDEEIRREQVSEGGSFDIMSMRRTSSSNTSVEYKQQRVVLASELQQLPNLSGILNIAGDIPPCVVAIPVAGGEAVAERFVQRERTKRLVQAPAPVSPAAMEGYAMPAPDEIDAEPYFDDAPEAVPVGTDRGPDFEPA